MGRWGSGGLMYDGIIPKRSGASVIYDSEGASWRPRFVRTSLCAPLKRSLDLLMALGALVFLAPFYALIALVIAIDSPGPILFRQHRTGFGGKVFIIYKFRTMKVAAVSECASHATRDDDRITRVGAFLRQTSLDELPQLLNIIKGDMALVGPRPHAIEHDAHYSALVPHYNRRFAVRPGLTGLAQVQGLRGEIRSIDDMAHRVDVDILYASHWSFFSDLSIIRRTIPLLLKRVNAY